MTLKNNKDIINALESKNFDLFETLINQKCSEISLSAVSKRFNNISRSEMFEEEEDASAVQNTTDDPTLDPGMEREYFLKSFEVGDVLVTIKTIGVGKNKPVSVYLDDQRWEMFPGPIKAEEEATEFIKSDQYEQWKERKGLLNNNQPETDDEKEENTPPIEGDKEEKEDDDDEVTAATTKKESVLNNLKRILNLKKPQKVIFESDESLIIDPYNANLIMTLFESLSKRNQFELTRLLNKNKFEFSRVAEFALKQLSSKD
jgi:hypothetical protein